MRTEVLPGNKEVRKVMGELQKGLEIIERAAKDGAATVRRIQEFSRRRDERYNCTALDLNKLITQSLEFTRVRWKDAAEAQGIHFLPPRALNQLDLG